MAFRKTKPTSPGRRFATYQTRDEVSAKRPHKPLTKGASKSGGRNAHGRVTARHRGGGAKRRYREIDFKRRRDGVAARVASDRVRPEPHLLHRAPALRRRAQELHPRAAGARGRRARRVRRGRRHPARQCAAAARRSRPAPIVHNVELVPGQGGRIGRVGRRGDPGRREGGPDGHAAPALVRDADGPRRLPGDRRHALERRAPERQGRQGRAQPPQGQAPADPRRRDEPGRPPARRRRGPPHPRRPPGDAVGQADARLPHPQEGQGLRRDDRARPPAREEEGARWDARRRRGPGPRSA